MDKSLTYETEEDLLKALREGAAPAFETLYRQYYRMVAKQASDAGREDAEDLFQELLVILVRKIREPEFRLSSKLGTYLYAIAKNLILKNANLKPEFSTGDISAFQRENPGVTEEEEEREKLEKQLIAIAGFLENMEEDCRRVLRLSFFDKRSQSEIAEEMGYAESFVKVKKHRCLDYLRKQVKSHSLFKYHSK